MSLTSEELSDKSDHIFQDLRKFSLPSNFRGASAIKVQLWWLVQSLLFHSSPQFLYGWRRFLLRAFGAEIGKSVIIRPSVRVTYPWHLKIGDYSQIGDRVELYTLGQIVIGDHVVISQDSYICTGGHDPADATFAIYRSPVNISDQVWLSSGTFVLPGVHIGQGAYSKVRSLVSRDVPAGAIVAGMPARVVGRRSDLSPLTITNSGDLLR